MRLISRFCSKLAVNTLKEKKKNVVEKICIEPEKAKFIPKKSKYINEIDAYLSDSPTRAAVHEIPSRFKNCLSNPPDSLVCVDSIAAKTIAVSILQNVTSGTLQNVPLLEMAPGPGFLSKCLLTLGATHLRLYEPQPQFNGQLQRKALDLNGKVQVFPQDLHNLARILFMDEVLQLDQMDSIMTGLNSDSKCVVIGACPSKKFLKLISYMVANDLGLPSYCQTEYFIIMHPYNYLRMTAGPYDGYYRYRYHTVAVQLFYDIVLLDKLDRKHFLSWEKPYKKKQKDKQPQLFSYDQDHLYLVQLVPKNLINELKAQEKKQLWYFLKFHMMKRTALVIPLIERWVPDCGDRLVHLGINERTRIGELRPTEILALFREFLSWPEFPHCSFNSSMETAYLKSNLENIHAPSDKQPTGGEYRNFILCFGTKCGVDFICTNWSSWCNKYKSINMVRSSRRLMT